MSDIFQLKADDEARDSVLRSGYVSSCNDWFSIPNFL